LKNRSSSLGNPQILTSEKLILSLRKTYNLEKDVSHLLNHPYDDDLIFLRLTILKRGEPLVHLFDFYSTIQFITLQQS
jgi:hypothetical protein